MADFYLFCAEFNRLGRNLAPDKPWFLWPTNFTNLHETGSIILMAT